MTYDLVFNDGNWWLSNTDTHSSILVMSLGKTSREAQEIAFGWAWHLGNKIHGIKNDYRRFERWTDPKVISIKGWDDNDHWMVAWEYSDGELAKVEQFPTKEEAEQWLIKFNSLKTEFQASLFKCQMEDINGNS